VASSSSTKKAARLAQKGKGKKVRFQGGVIFPIAVATTLIVGLALIVYGRATLPAADASPPTINDHWHAAYGFYLCDTWYQLDGNLEEVNSQGQLVNTEFLSTGIHSHDDGVIHWHPYTARAVGKRATLGVFLDVYDVQLENDRLTFPEEQVAAIGVEREYIEGETQCDGEDAELSVRAWQSFTDTDNGKRYIANMDQIHVDNDGMVFGIYFTNDDAPQTMPPWAEQLPQLGEIDAGQVAPEDLLGGLTSVLEDELEPSVEQIGGTGDDTSDSADTSDTADTSGG
jgi:hypothetical protein